MCNVNDDERQPRFYPKSEYVRLLSDMDSRNTATICSLGIFYHTPFDKVAGPIRDAALKLQTLLQNALYDLARGD